MADLRFQDIGYILVALVLIATIRVLFAYRAEISLLIGALWHRYVSVGDWRAAMDRLADERASVRGYVDDGAGIEPDRSGIEPLVPAPVLPLPDASNTGTWIPVPDDLSRHELLDILARQKIDNKYVFSGNKLAELFSSTPHAVSRNVILEEIARARKGDEPEPPKKPPARLERPVNGW
jgi:hypothetical protein